MNNTHDANHSAHFLFQRATRNRKRPTTTALSTNEDHTTLATPAVEPAMDDTVDGRGRIPEIPPCMPGASDAYDSTAGTVTHDTTNYSAQLQPSTAAAPQPPHRAIGAHNDNSPTTTTARRRRFSPAHAHHPTQGDPGTDGPQTPFLGATAGQSETPTSAVRGKSAAPPPQRRAAYGSEVSSADYQNPEKNKDATRWPLRPSCSG